MKECKDLVPGDVIKKGGIEFKVKHVLDAGGGKVCMIFEDMAAKKENVDAYLELLKIASNPSMKRGGNND